jgi:hypothetical protein
MCMRRNIPYGTGLANKWPELIGYRTLRLHEILRVMSLAWSRGYCTESSQGKEEIRSKRKKIVSPRCAL